MKFIIIITLALLQNLYADDQIFAPEVITVKPENVFAAPGFDNNDVAQITISGTFLSTCFKTGELKNQVDLASKRIVLRNEILFYKKCEGVMTPIHYSETTNLGILPTGKYSLYFQVDNTLQPAGSMEIGASKSAQPDESVYLALDDAKITSSSGKTSLIITGYLTSDCMKMDKIQILTRTPNIIEVLPIISVDRNVKCSNKRTLVKQNLKIEKHYSGHVLIHARSMSGKSINRVVEF